MATPIAWEVHKRSALGYETKCAKYFCSWNKKPAEFGCLNEHLQCFGNAGLDALTYYHRLSLFVLVPGLLVLLLLANYVQIWKRNNSPYIPLTVNMLCMVTVYGFYELLRRPVFASLHRLLRTRDSSIDAVSDNSIHGHVPILKSANSLPWNATSKTVLQAALARVVERLRNRTEDLRDMLARPNHEDRENAAEPTPKSAKEINLDAINIDYDPKNPRRVCPSTWTKVDTTVEEYTCHQGFVHQYSKEHYGSANELARLQDKRHCQRSQAYLVRSNTHPAVVWVVDGFKPGLCAGYIGVLVGAGLVFLFAGLFIFVI